MDVTAAPPPVYREGTLQIEANTVTLHTDTGESILLPGAPFTLVPGRRVLVAGHIDNDHFVWDVVYRAELPPDTALSLSPDTLRQVVRIEPAYWLMWKPEAGEEGGRRGNIIPVWRITAGTQDVEETLIYPMEGSAPSP